MYFATVMRSEKMPGHGLNIATGSRLCLLEKLTLFKLKRSRCAAGHKAMWHDDFNGLPDQRFLTKLDPALTGLREQTFQQNIYM